MKKTIFISLVLVFILGLTAHAAENELFNIRNKIFEEIEIIKPLLTVSKDVILLNSLWDSCIITVTRLDAYFFMQGIFDTIKEEDINEVSIDYLLNWLNVMKKTNSSNIKNLALMSHLLEETTKTHMQRVRGNFDKLNGFIDKDIEKLSLLRKSIKK